MKKTLMLLSVLILIACSSSNLFARRPRIVGYDWWYYFTYDNSIDFRIELSTDIYGVGYSSFTTYYGDGSNLTGISSFTNPNWEQYFSKANYNVTVSTNLKLPNNVKHIYGDDGDGMIYSDGTFFKIQSSNASIFLIPSTNLGVHIRNSQNAVSVFGYDEFNSEIFVNLPFDFNGNAITGGGSGHDQFSDFVTNEHIDWTNASVDFVTTGDGTVDELILTEPSQDWKFTGTQTPGALGLQSQTSGTQPRFQLFSKDGDATDNVYIDIFGLGTPASISTSHKLVLGYSQNDDDYLISSTSKTLRFHSGEGVIQITLNTDGSIDVGGDLRAVGDITCDELTITAPSANDMKIVAFPHGDSSGITFESQTSDVQCWLNMMTKDGDGADKLQFRMWAKGTTADITNAEYLRIFYNTTGPKFQIDVLATGTGTVLPLHLATGTNADQIVLNTDGSVSFGTGNVSVTGGVFEVEGTADPLVIFDQNTTGAAIVNFEGTQEKDGTGTIDTQGTGYSSATTNVAAPSATNWAVVKMIKIKVNGATMWIPAYNSGGM